MGVFDFDIIINVLFLWAALGIDPRAHTNTLPLTYGKISTDCSHHDGVFLSPDLYWFILMCGTVMAGEGYLVKGRLVWEEQGWWFQEHVCAPQIEALTTIEGSLLHCTPPP